MFVKQFRLNNIRGFRNAKLEFSRSLNIITGKNNSGKSTILKAIYLLQRPHSLLKRDITIGAETAKVLIMINDISEQDLRSFKQRDVPLQNLYGKNILIKYDFTNSNEQGIGVYIPADYISSIKDDGGEVFLNDTAGARSFNSFEGINDNQLTNNFIFPFFSKRKINYSTTRVDLKDMHNVSEDFNYLVAKVKKLSNPGHPQNKQFLQNCEEILGFKVGLVPDNNAQENIGLFVTDASILAVDQMGDGVIHIVGLIALLLTENNKLYIIEEPENDVHPQALKALLNLIIKKSENNQFIVSTHSNIVLKYLGSIKDSKIFELEGSFDINEENNTAIPLSTANEIENTPQERMKILEKIGYEPWDFEIYKSYLILEESSAESIIRDFLIPTFVSGLTGKIRTIAANGASKIKARLEDLLRLFVYIHTNPLYKNKAWVIADGDDAGREVIEEVSKKFSSWPPTHFRTFSKKNFEEYYPLTFRNKFEEILAGPSELKRDRKKKLTEEMMDYIGSNPKAAQAEFSESAKEVILILQEIQENLNSE